MVVGGGGGGDLVDARLAAVPLEKRRALGGGLHLGVHAHPAALVLKLVNGQLPHQPSQQACMPSFESAILTPELFFEFREACISTPTRAYLAIPCVSLHAADQ